MSIIDRDHPSIQTGRGRDNGDDGNRTINERGSSGPKKHVRQPQSPAVRRKANDDLTRGGGLWIQANQDSEIRKFLPGLFGRLRSSESFKQRRNRNSFLSRRPVCLEVQEGFPATGAQGWCLPRTTFSKGGPEKSRRRNYRPVETILPTAIDSCWCCRSVFHM